MTARPELPETADVVIVGGGIMGTSTAFFCATQTDLDVLLLEKDAIASGSTGDSSAILRHHYGDQEIYSRMAWWSHQFYRAFEDRTGQRIAHEDNPLVRFGADDDTAGEYARAGYDVLASLDIPVSRYEGDGIEEAYPMLDLADVDVAISDDAAGYSDGTDAAGGFARAANERDATVLTGVAVEEIRVDDGAVAGVDTDHGAVDAGAVVVTAGPWTPRLLSTVGVEVPIERSREQVIVLEPTEEYLAAYGDDTPTTGPPGGDWYMRPDFADGVLVATHHTGSDVDPDTYDDDPDEAVLLDLVEKVSSFVPELADARLRGKYCGVYSDTPDLDFVIDEVGPEGCYVGCGFSGHGFKHGPAVGRILTDLVVDGDTDLVDVGYFSLDRFDDDPHGHGKPADKI